MSGNEGYYVGFLNLEHNALKVKLDEGLHIIVSDKWYPQKDKQSIGIFCNERNKNVNRFQKK